jgi:selenocysteine lyase/cysteine desulfurase
MNKDDYRQLFSHHNDGTIYLNHAAISPLPNATADAIKSFTSSRQHGPVEDFENWMAVLEETREYIARLIHTDSDGKITFMGNTSDGISAVAESLSWDDGDEILLNTMEFPSNVQPFRALVRKGVSIRYIQPENGMVTPDMIRDAITPKTRLVSISAVQYLNGFRADLQGIGEICKEKDLWFVVDGIQALGATDINVEASHIDALATGGHKWLMSPLGTGFLYLSSSIAGSMTPSKTGWLSVEEPWELSNFEQPWQPVNQHLETGTMNMAGIIGMHASLKMFLNIGISNIRNELLMLTDEIMRLLKNKSGVTIITPAEAESRSGILTFSRDRGAAPDEVIQNLKQQKIIMSAREGFFRIAPHFYNTPDELEHAINQLFKW